MTKYKLMAAAAVLCMAAGADARAEEKSGKSDLRANFRRVALEMSSTEVKKRRSLRRQSEFPVKRGQQDDDQGCF